MQTIEVMSGPQSEFVASEARYPGYFAGRRGGKTSASVVKMVKYVSENPGATGMFTVPTLGDIDRILVPKMDEFFGSGRNRWWVYLEKKQQFQFPGQQATVFLRTASEPDSLRGMTLAFAAMDEVGTEDQEEAFRILQPAVTQAGFRHQIWVTSTPNVRRKWIKQRWEQKINPLTGESLPNPEQYPIFRARTIDNYFLTEEDRNELVSEWSGTRWGMQELEGEFITVEGLAFPELNPDIHLRYPPEGTEFIATVTGLDFGERRPTALVTLKMDRSRRIWAISEFYKRDATDYDWIRWCADHDVKRVICDPSASDKDLAHWRQVYGLSIHRAPPPIRRFDGRARIWGSRIAVKDDGLPGLFVSPACPNLWDELQNLAFHRTKHDEGGSWAPGTADHAYDAGAYGMSYFEKARGDPPKTSLRYSGW